MMPLATAAQELGSTNSATEEKERGSILPVVCDVTDEKDVAALFHTASSKLGSVDLVVNNAGVAALTPLPEIAIEEWEQVFSVCVTGTFLITREYARSLDAVRTPATTNRAVVNISSLNYSAPTEGLAHYCAAKAAVSQFTQVAALELAPKGARVNAIAPGLTRTPMSEGSFMAGRMGEAFLSRTPLGRFGEPDDVAKVVLFLCSEYAQWITGHTILVDGGAHMRGLHNYLETMGGA